MSWTLDQARDALARIAYAEGRVPVLADVRGRWRGETPSVNWFYRRYPGGWRAAVRDATGLEALPACPPMRGPGGPGFADPDLQARAQAARRTNRAFNPYGALRREGSTA